MAEGNNHLVIMAGGVGSRLYPMSTLNCPKQFIDVLGCGKTLLQLTYERFLSVVPRENVWVVTSESYKDLVAEQLPDIPQEQILLEPCPRKLSPEEQKLLRINANYEHDRAVLAKSDPTFMAKNQFWDVGHAQGNDEMTDALHPGCSICAACLRKPSARGG